MSRVQATDLVERVEVPEQLPVLVDHPLGCTRRPRRVHDHHPVVRRDVSSIASSNASGTSTACASSAAKPSSHTPRRCGATTGRSPPTNGPTAVVDRNRVVVAAVLASPRGGDRRRHARTGHAARGEVENVLMGTAMAPIRAVASHASTKSTPVGNSSPIRLPRPAPSASSPRARRGCGVRRRHR